MNIQTFVFLITACCIVGCTKPIDNTRFAPGFKKDVFAALPAHGEKEEEVAARLGLGHNKLYRMVYPGGAENNVKQIDPRGVLKSYAIYYSYPKDPKHDYTVFEVVFDRNGRAIGKNIFDTD
jgi:hypothetical protein